MSENADKASLTAIFEEFFAEIALTRKETQLLRKEVQDLNADLSLVRESFKGWVEHLEKVFTTGAVVQIMEKELNQLSAISKRLDEVSGSLKHDFELIQKPQKRRFFGF
ncbi:MAG: hypothetical protein IKZ88_08515 [Neisseriaceae bacterium]|nr:hypothetical protein [Neisseriaceae bacterium]